MNINGSSIACFSTTQITPVYNGALFNMYMKHGLVSKKGLLMNFRQLRLWIPSLFRPVRDSSRVHFYKAYKKKGL